jgi:uncharacterized membrane protein
MNKKLRPKIKLKMTNLDKGIEIFGWLILAGIWILTLTNYSNLPETIPIHFNGAGKVDGFGNKSNILTLPIVASILNISMTIVNYFPHRFNYPNSITTENVFKSYTNATRLVRILKLVVVILFGMIVYRTLQNINGTADGLGIWFLPLSMGLIFIPTVYFLIKTITKHSYNKTGNLN